MTCVKDREHRSTGRSSGLADARLVGLIVAIVASIGIIAAMA